MFAYMDMLRARMDRSAFYQRSDQDRDQITVQSNILLYSP